MPLILIENQHGYTCVMKRIVNEESEWKKTFEKEADQIFTLCIIFRSAQSELETTFTFVNRHCQSEIVYS